MALCQQHAVPSGHSVLAIPLKRHLRTEGRQRVSMLPSQNIGEWCEAVTCGYARAFRQE